MLGLEGRSKDVRTRECPFEVRLQDFAGGDFFAYGETEEATEASFAGLVEMMKIEGLLFFAAFEAEALMPLVKRLAKEGTASFVPLRSPAHPGTWEKLATHLGDVASAKALAAEGRAFEERIAETRRRNLRIHELGITGGPGITLQCIADACERLDAKTFTAFERTIEALPVEERLSGAMAHLESHHRDVVVAVKARFEAAHRP